MIEMPPTAQHWLLVDMGSEHVATATAPDGFALFDLSEDLLVGVPVDALGVEKVRAYRIVPSEPAP